MKMKLEFIVYILSVGGVTPAEIMQSHHCKPAWYHYKS